ncbi:quinolinate synthase NadA [Candidatus Peregrinibacteria bacterium]|nr:quinolinate synthase NadA [Candidatus Peregrinibacteria bacterium]
MESGILNAELVKRINELKRKKNAIVLVHNYQRPEIYDVADFIGDSLGLCQQARKTNASIIVFCGVNFMAESAAILNPGKKVIAPCLDAGCAMADMVEARDLFEFKKKHPDADVVTYVNSSAEVKALSDVCCTSSNAVDVVRSRKSRKIIFVPDKNLAAYVQKQVPEKEIIAWQGYCPVHHYVNKEYLEEVRRENPEAKIIAHPESKPEVLEMADYIASTSGMIDVALRDAAEEFFVLTECGMTERLHKEIPEKKFKGLCNLCFDMKKNTLPAILKCLEDESPIVTVDAEVAKRALKAFDEMFRVSIAPKD